MRLFSHLIYSLSKMERLKRWRLRSSERKFAALSEEERSLMVDALYIKPEVIAMCVAFCVFGSVVCFVQSADFNYLYFAVAFLVGGLNRVFQMRNYAKDKASRSFTQWKHLALKNSLVHGLSLGLFGAYAITAQLPFNELIAISVVLGNLIELPSRSFSSRSMVNFQLMAIGLPVITACLFQPIGNYWLLAALTLPMFSRVSFLAKKSRNTLLQVVNRKPEIKRLLEQFDTATNFMQHGFIIIDGQDKIVVANARALQLLGIENTNDWIGRNYHDMLQRSVQAKKLTLDALEQLPCYSDNQQQLTGTHKVLIKTADERFLDSSTSYCQEQIVILLEDVTERIRVADRITYMATHDSLTGLCNREHFHDLFTQSLKEISGGRCMLAVIDLDDFKHVNDTYGHAAGDELLCGAASTIERVCGDYAIACRFGGDEFMVFVPQVENKSEFSFAQRLLEELSHKIQLSHGTVEVKASIGIVVEEHSKATAEGMFAKADLALYNSKDNARGQWSLYEPALDANHREKQHLKDELTRAIDRDELTVKFQPIVDLGKRRVDTFEALSRWTHKELGEISPAVFIPLAEEMGTVGTITLIVLRKSIEECCHWPEDIGISVNLSAIDFDNPRLVHEIDKLLWASQLDPTRLEVEITEGTFIENKQRVSSAVAQLRELGVKIALDDFGTGYSNFSYLQEISLNKLKIDRCFVKDILVNDKSTLLLSGISDIAKRLGMQVTVEGIESLEQLTAVRKIANIDFVQGWVFSKAVDAEEARQLATHLFSVPGNASGEDLDSHIPKRLRA